MKIFQHHKRTTVLLTIYLMWWLFMAYIFWVDSHTSVIYRPHCDFTPIIFFGTIPITIGGSLVLLGKQIDSKNNSNDYLLFAGLFLLPLIIAAGIYSFSNKNTKQIVQTRPINVALNICDSQQMKKHPKTLYKKANHKLGYWIHKKL